MNSHFRPTARHIAGIIDHTFLKTENEGVSLTQQESAVKQVIAEALQWGAYAVCLRPQWVTFAKKVIPEQSPLRIVSVVGFPNGDQVSTQEKIKETRQALNDGADEIDMVLRVNDLIHGRDREVINDIKAVSNNCQLHTLKIIIETAYLNRTQKIQACHLIMTALEEEHGLGSSVLHRRFVKTSTGFAKVTTNVPIGATLADVRLIHETIGGKLGIKAAGGVSHLKDAIDFWQAAGAPQLGDSIDPMRFRIGSSGLLTSLFNSSITAAY